MVVAVLVIVITIASVFLLMSGRNLWRVASLRRPAGGVLRDTLLGLAELRLPAGWRPALHLNEAAALQAIDPLRGRYVVVISEAREDFEPGFDLSEHSLLTRQPLTRKLRVVGFRGPETREVRGFAALQYEFDAFAGSLYMTYLHTTIQGDRAFHQVLGWAPHSRFDRATFEQLLDSFTEIPRSDPGPAVPYVPQLPGHYEVH